MLDDAWRKRARLCVCGGVDVMVKGRGGATDNNLFAFHMVMSWSSRMCEGRREGRHKHTVEMFPQIN